MSKPRVLMLITHYLPSFSGHAIYLQKLIPLMLARGYQIEVLTGDFGRYLPLEYIDGVKIHRLPFDPRETRSAIRFTIRILGFLLGHRNKFDILHINGHMDWYGVLTIACKALGKRILMQMVLMGSDDPDSLRNANYRFMSVRLRIIALMDRFLYISAPIGESCKRAGLSSRKLRYIPSGVDIHRFRPVTEQEKVALRSRLGLPQNKKIVSFVGAIIRRKGVDFLLDAWKQVQVRCPTAELVLVGPCEFGSEDADEAALNSFVKAARMQISEGALNARMVGRSDHVESFLQASDLFVLPSTKEGFGNVILEAMSCGIPPIVTYMDGVSLESITPGKTGLIVNSRAELASALQDLLTNDERRTELGMNARVDVVQRFCLEDIAARYLAVYDELT